MKQRFEILLQVPWDKVDADMKVLDYAFDIITDKIPMLPSGTETARILNDFYDNRRRDVVRELFCTEFAEMMMDYRISKGVALWGGDPHVDSYMNIQTPKQELRKLFRNIVYVDGYMFARIKSGTFYKDLLMMMKLRGW